MCAHEKINTIIIISKAVENYRCMSNGKQSWYSSNKCVPDEEVCVSVVFIFTLTLKFVNMFNGTNIITL